MEAVALTAGLIPLFQSCFDIHDKISTIRNATVDILDVQTRLELEMTKVRLTKSHFDRETLNQPTADWVELQLEYIKRLLEDVDHIVSRNIKSDRSSSLARSDGGGGERHRFSMKPMERVKWVAKDKNNVNEKMSLLHDSVESLWSMVSTLAQRTAASYKMTGHMISTRDETVLSAVAALPAREYSGIARAARVKKLLLQSQMTVNGTRPEGARLARRTRWKINANAIQLTENRKFIDVTTEVWSVGDYHTQGAGDVAVLIEWRGPFMGNADTGNHETRLDELCELLGAMHVAEGDFHDAASFGSFERSSRFGMLKCLGWITPQGTFNHIGIVFQFPRPGARPPRSLHRKIRDTRRNKKIAPPLGDRFDLAFGICTVLANIVQVEWTHRAVRSENMLIFDERLIRNVYLVGFTYARPENRSSEFSALPDRPDLLLYRPPPPRQQTSGDTDVDSVASLSLDEAQQTPAEDLYGLGIVLLEIGLWKTGDRMIAEALGPGATDARKFQAEHLEKYVAQLSERCGEIYHDVVKTCLAPSSDEDDSLKESLGEIVSKLSQCRA